MSQWVSAAIHVNVNHHLRRVDEYGHARTECGARLVSFVLAAFPEVAECWQCAEHVYARDNGRMCAHCHKKPRKVAA